MNDELYVMALDADCQVHIDPEPDTMWIDGPKEIRRWTMSERHRVRRTMVPPRTGVRCPRWWEADDEVTESGACCRLTSIGD